MQIAQASNNGLMGGAVVFYAEAGIFGRNLVEHVGYALLVASPLFSEAARSAPPSRSRSSSPSRTRRKACRWTRS
jgi:hypothetical protein